MNVLLAVIISCAFVGALPQKNIEVSIINGKNAKLNQFPYIVSIQEKKSHWCGAVIISSKWLLSAAHCYYGLFNMKFVAVAGLLKQGEKRKGMQTIPITNIIYPPDAYGDLYAKDAIAMLKLKKPLKFNKFVKPVRLPKRNAIPLSKAVVSGWGLTKTNPMVEASTLQYLQMYLITDKECKTFLSAVNPFFVLPRNSFCTLPHEAYGSICFGDSGSPLVQNNVLVGIVLDAIDTNCAQKYSTPVPSLFNNVSLYIDFIKTHIKS